jgi:tetratricopeptide (TPR) repeat protein
MVSCKQCNTLNSIDSTFCKKCGTTLSPDDIAEASDKLTAMIADGNKLFADGRTDEAMMVAETAVANNPTSAAAISLKGMCHERKGQVAEALECFERVIQLNPDSMLDKLKVNDLRNMMVAQKLEAPKSDRRMPIVAAFAATVLVIAGGALIAKAANKPTTQNPNLVASNTQQPDNTMRFGDVMGAANTGQQQQQTQTQQTNPNANYNQQQMQDDGLGPRVDTRPQMNLPNYGDRRLPRPEEGANGFPNTEIRPVNPGPPPSGAIGQGNGGGILPKPNTNNGGGGSVDPDPGEMQTKQDPPKTDPQESPGIIEINFSKGGGNNGSQRNGNNAATPNGRESLIQAARSQYLSGNYQGAANSYERALRAGADQASTNQRLGQCYERMGKNNDAIAAYQRAANAIETAMSSGNGDKASLQRTLDSCRQAIKVLGG